MTQHTLPFVFPYQTTVLVLCNAAVPSYDDAALWQDYLVWQRAISEDDLFCLMIEESRPRFALLNSAERQALYHSIVPYLPEAIGAAMATCANVVTVTCGARAEEFISAPFWGAMTFASFLASTADGILVDPVLLKAFEPTPRLLRSHNSAIPFAETFLAVTGTENRGVFDMQSRGNARFGLPEVAMLGVSEDDTNLAAMVIRTYVQQLWTEIEIARQGDPMVRQTNVPEEIDSQYAPGVYGLAETSIRHFTIPVEWSVQSNAAGQPIVVLAPTGDERSWDEWFASYGEVLNGLQKQAAEQRDAEGYDVAAQEAREALPTVLSRFANGEIVGGELYFKCSFLTRSDDGPPEYMWVQVRGANAVAFMGELRNKSAYDEALQPGQTVTLGLDEVHDWVIEYDDGRLEGGYSR